MRDDFTVYQTTAEAKRRVAVVRAIRFAGALRELELLISSLDPDSDEADELFVRKHRLEGLR